MLKTIPIINNKGGVGKTTTTVNLAAGLARRGRRVLVVDLDSQGSASLSFGIDRNALAPCSAEVLFGDVPIGKAIRSTHHGTVDLLTGSLELADAGVRLKQQPDGQYRLAEVLSEVEDDYETILVDCAPSTSILSINALVAADAFIIPVTPSYLSLEGVVSLGEVIQRVRSGLGEAAPILGLALTMVDAVEREEVGPARMLRKHYGGKVFDTEIRRDPTFDKAHSRNLDIFQCAPESPGAADYQNLVDEVEQRLQRYGSVYGNLGAAASDEGVSAKQDSS